MIIGPNTYFECSVCSKIIVRISVCSVNSMGAKFWTDGHMKAPMWPDFPKLVKCPHCDKGLWIRDLLLVSDGFKKRINLRTLPLCIRELYKTQPWLADDYDDGKPLKHPPRDVSGAMPPNDLSHDEYIKFLKANILDEKREEYIRRRIWRTGNDKRRNGNSSIPLSSDEIINLRLLLDLNSESDTYSYIIRAEIFRELGDFDSALEMVSNIRCKNALDAISHIIDLIKSRDPVVGLAPGILIWKASE